METYIEKGEPFKGTRSAKDLIGLRVLTSTGEMFGRVSEVRLHGTSNALEGMVVGRKHYVCKTYIQKITEDAVLLDIEPAVMFIGRKVITSDGKVFGKVKKITRVDHTNEIASFVVTRSFFRKTTLQFSTVKKLSHSVILKKTFEEVRKRGA